MNETILFLSWEWVTEHLYFYARKACQFCFSLLLERFSPTMFDTFVFFWLVASKLCRSPFLVQELSC